MEPADTSVRPTSVSSLLIEDQEVEIGHFPGIILLSRFVVQPLLHANLDRRSASNGSRFMFPALGKMVFQAPKNGAEYSSFRSALDFSRSGSFEPFERLRVPCGRPDHWLKLVPANYDLRL